MTVHTFPWNPKTVTVNATESTEYLGGLYDINNGSKAALKHIRDTATQQCNAILHASVSAINKIMVATTSTLAKVRYKASLSSIRYKASLQSSVRQPGTWSASQQPSYTLQRSMVDWAYDDSVMKYN